MRFIYTACLTTLLFFTANAQSPQVSPYIAWQTVLGGTDADELHDILPTADGGFLLAGHSASDISGSKTVANKGLKDYWLVKLDATGDTLWQRAYGGTGYDLLNNIEATEDGGFLLAGSSASDMSADHSSDSYGDYDFWVVKIGANGDILWEKTIGGSLRDHLTVAKQTADGGYILGGNSQSPVSGLKTDSLWGSYDYWVVKLDTARNITWQYTFGGTYWEDLYDVHETADGGFVLGGHSSSGATGNKLYDNIGVANQTHDFWLIKLDATGTQQWQKVIGGDMDEVFYQMEPTADNGFVIVGYSDSGISGDKTEAAMGWSDYWVVKVDATGTLQWENTLGGDGGEDGTSIQQTMDGGYIVGGYSESGISGDKTEDTPMGVDYWMLQLDTAGAVVWDKTIDLDELDFLTTIQQTSENEFIVGGYSGDDTTGDYEYWVVKLEACSAIETNVEMNACEEYTDPIGNTYTESGNYTYTMNTSFGCDSIINLFLNVNNNYEVDLQSDFCDQLTLGDGTVLTADTMLANTYSSVSGCDSTVYTFYNQMESTSAQVIETACDSYTTPTGEEYTSPGNYSYVVPNAAGCDSFVYLVLSLNYSTYTDVDLELCEGSMLPDSTIITQDTTLIEEYVNSIGCDSIVMVYVSVLESSTATLSEWACDNYFLPDGTELTESGVYISTYTGGNGCDSSVVLELTIWAPATDTSFIEACENYVDNFGIVYETSGTYTTTFLGGSVNGCDSTYVLDLDITDIDTEIMQEELTLTVAQTDATYQWIDCKNNTLIAGANQQSYTAPADGEYAVQIWKNDCEMTSACYNLSTVGVNSAFQNALSVFPNPTTGNVQVELDQVYEEVKITVYNSLGELIKTGHYTQINNTSLDLEGPDGFYLLQIETNDGQTASFKVLKL